MGKKQNGGTHQIEVIKLNITKIIIDESKLLLVGENILYLKIINALKIY